MMTQAEMNRLVPEKLREIERGQGVTMLHAVETGSRSWGFASPDSDFDVRFIYIRPRSDYLRLNAPRDVIETPIDDTWDLSGWDLQKALRLLWKSNPSLYEWLGSKISYLESDFARRIAPLLELYFGRKAMMYHYYYMADRNIRTFLRGELVKPKKYFYALRPILACRWIVENNSVPPIRYADLVEASLPESVKPANEALLDLKINMPEKGEVPPMREVQDFIDQSMEALKLQLNSMPNDTPGAWEPLNRFFLQELDRLEQRGAER